MNKVLSLGASLLLTGTLLRAQPCSTFDGPSPQGNWMNIYAGINFSNLNPLDGSQCATLRDQPGGSSFENATDFRDLYRNYRGQCLCFDYNVTDDGYPNTSTPIKPTIYVTNGSQYIYFEAAVTVYEGSGWVHVCAPIALSSASGLPGNADGQWKMPAGYTNSDFDNIITNSQKLVFFVDVAGSSYQTEDVRIDNVCVRECGDDRPLPCVKFNNDADVGSWYTQNASFNFGTNSLDGSQAAILGDQSGASYYLNNSDYNNLATNWLHKCLCFDYYVGDDGHYGTSVPINPSIYLSNGSQYVWFQAAVTVYEGSGWVHVCAPIELSSGSGLPSNADGQWMMPAGYTNSDFDNVISNVSQVFFIVDVAGSSYQTEVIGVDNVCVMDCSSPIRCNSGFLVQTSQNTDPLGYPFPASYEANLTLNYNNPGSTYVIDWGDGNTSSPPSTSHTYAGPGSYLICVTEYQREKAVCKTCMSICFGQAYDVYLDPNGGNSDQPQGRKGSTGTTNTAPANSETMMNAILGKNFHENNFTIYPNPSKEQAELKLNLHKKEQVSIRVIDVLGKVVLETGAKTFDSGTQHVKINTEALPVGVYNVEVTSGSEVSVLKLSVIK